MYPYPEQLTEKELTSLIEKSIIGLSQCKFIDPEFLKALKATPDHQTQLSLMVEQALRSLLGMPPDLRDAFLAFGDKDIPRPIVAANLVNVIKSTFS